MIFSENRNPLFRIMPLLVEHDLFGKPESTFPDHALASMQLRMNDVKRALCRPLSTAGRAEAGPCLTDAARETAPDVPFVKPLCRKPNSKAAIIAV
jgi:hypothetical protein